MKYLAILGATGSIGRSTYKVVTRFPEQFSVKVLTARNNIVLLAEQIRALKPELAVVYEESGARELRKLLPAKLKTEILYGREGYLTGATWQGVDMVVGAMVGASGLEPTLAAIAAGKDIALANKETLVMAGGLVMQAVARQGIRLLPVDSEHSAIFQCLQGQRREDLKKILLTASGGPFLDMPAEAFAKIDPAMALKHPNWKMGAKITIDSATLMNKGLEVIEARWLFDLLPHQIEVVVHPQSIIHSMVAFQDGAILAQMGIPDMQGAIAYALSYPQRLPLELPLPDLVNLSALTFRKPDLDRFGCLSLAFDALDVGGTAPAVVNAANEVAVGAFLAQKISFPAIYTVISQTLEEHLPATNPELDDIMAADSWARRAAQIKVDAMAKFL
jgi:1-deoxy-D-xylulose-5-phosphate reductoisomerase